MARIVQSGFELGFGVGGSVIEGLNLFFAGAIVTSPVRTGTYAVDPGTGSNGIQLSLDSGNWIRFYLYLNSAPSSSDPVYHAAGGALLAHLWLTTNRTVSVRDSVGADVGTSTTTCKLNGWTCIEYRWVSGTGTAVQQLRMNGRLEVDVSNSTVATAPTNLVDANGTISAYDDIVINDSTGSVNNSWPGPGNISLLNPVSDTATINWTSTGASHYTEIDDIGSYDTATIISTISKTQDFEDRWNIGTLPSVMDPSAAVSAIMFGVHGGGDAATSRTALLRLTSGADVLNSADTEWNLNGYKTVWPIITREQTWGGTPVALTRAYLAALTAAAIDTNTNTRLINWATVWGNVDWQGHAWLPAPPSQALQRVRR